MAEATIATLRAAAAAQERDWIRDDEFQRATVYTARGMAWADVKAAIRGMNPPPVADAVLETWKATILAAAAAGMFALDGV